MVVGGLIDVSTRSSECVVCRQAVACKRATAYGQLLYEDCLGSACGGREVRHWLSLGTETERMCNNVRGWKAVWRAQTRVPVVVFVLFRPGFLYLYEYSSVCRISEAV